MIAITSSMLDRSAAGSSMVFSAAGASTNVPMPWRVSTTRAACRRRDRFADDGAAHRQLLHHRDFCGYAVAGSQDAATDFIGKGGHHFLSQAAHFCVVAGRYRLKTRASRARATSGDVWTLAIIASVAKIHDALDEARELTGPILDG